MTLMKRTDQFLDPWPAHHSCHRPWGCCASWQMPVRPAVYELPQQQSEIQLHYLKLCSEKPMCVIRTHSIIYGTQWTTLQHAKSSPEHFEL